MLALLFFGKKGQRVLGDIRVLSVAAPAGGERAVRAPARRRTGEGLP